jgi:outer membrane lipoprotein LolB
MGRAKGWVAALALLGLAGCATAPPPVVTPPSGWHQGRLLVEVMDTPAQRHQLQYVLQGTAQTGRLTLLAATGQALGQAQWQPGQAVVRQGAAQREFDTAQAMTQALLPTSLPWQAMVDWLQGRPTPAPGWRVQPGPTAAPSVVATRQAPAPLVRVRVWKDAP